MAKQRAYGRKDVPIASGVPKAFAGQAQLDGTPTSHFTAPYSGPRNKVFNDRPAVPDRAGDSGMEASMHRLADKEHGRK